MKNIQILLFATSLLYFSACQDWEEMVIIPPDTTVKSSRVVLLEEFTGASCPNCPQGSAAVADLLNLYPKNIVVIGVHSTFLAAPAAPNDPNLITSDANDIENFLGSRFGKPEASINRMHFPNQPNIRILSPSTWRSFIEQELNIPTKIELGIKKSYDTTTRVLNVEVTAEILQDINHPINIHFAITESNIITSQKDGAIIVSGFNQKHVLRELITPTAGEKLADNARAGQKLPKKFSFKLPTDAVLWKAENCNAVIFVSGDETNKPVLQAAEVHVL